MISFAQKCSFECCDEAACEWPGVPHKILDLSVLHDIAPLSLTQEGWKVPEGYYADETMKQIVVQRSIAKRNAGMRREPEFSGDERSRLSSGVQGQPRLLGYFLRAFRTRKNSCRIFSQVYPDTQKIPAEYFLKSIPTLKKFLQNIFSSLSRHSKNSCRIFSPTCPHVP